MTAPRYDGLNGHAKKVVVGSRGATYDYGLKAAWPSARSGFRQVRQVGKGGNSHPFKQYARSGRRLGEPVVGWQDANTDGDPAGREAARKVARPRQLTPRAWCVSLAAAAVGALVGLCPHTLSKGQSVPSTTPTGRDLVGAYLRLVREEAVPKAAVTTNEKGDETPEGPAADRSDERRAIERGGDEILEEFIAQYRGCDARMKEALLRPRYWPIVTPRAMDFVIGELDGVDYKSIQAAELLAAHGYRQGRARIRALYDYAVRCADSENCIGRLGICLILLGDHEPLLEKLHRLGQESRKTRILMPDYYGVVIQEICLAHMTKVCLGPMVERMLQFEGEDRARIAVPIRVGLWKEKVTGLMEPADVIVWVQGREGVALRVASWMTLAGLAYFYHDHEYALLCCDKALAILPRLDEARYTKAFLLKTVGDYRGASQIAGAFVHAHPRDVRARILFVDSGIRLTAAAAVGALKPKSLRWQGVQRTVGGAIRLLPEALTGLPRTVLLAGNMASSVVVYLEQPPMLRRAYGSPRRPSTGGAGGGPG